MVEERMHATSLLPVKLHEGQFVFDIIVCMTVWRVRRSSVSLSGPAL